MNSGFVLVIQGLRDQVATLQQENDQLNERLAVLDALEAGGVDNWEGYEMAMENVG
jgi:hypothetical protein